VKYSISILAHNNAKITERCIDSVIKHSKDYELILTNNGSSDETDLMMQAYRLTVPGCVYVRNKINEGFIKPNITALEISTGEFFVMLNSDTQVQEGWLEALESPFHTDPLCAISGAQGCAMDDDCVGHPSRHVEYIEGSCLMIESKFAKRIGLFDSNLVGAYGDDLDLSLRVRFLGFNIHTVPIDIKHLGGTTSSMVPQANAWLKQNLSYLKTKWADYLKTRTFDAPSNFTD